MEGVFVLNNPTFKNLCQVKCPAKSPNHNRTASSLTALAHSVNTDEGGVYWMDDKGQAEKAGVRMRVSVRARAGE